MDVEPSNLRARAYSRGGLYTPVLIGGLGTGRAYDIVFHANRDTKITRFEIRRGGRVVYSDRKTTFTSGQTPFNGMVATSLLESTRSTWKRKSSTPARARTPSTARSTLFTIPPGSTSAPYS